MNQISWKARIGIVFSGLWLVIIYSVTSDSESWRSMFAILGIAPVAFIWGAVWIIKGFFAERKIKSVNSTSVDPAEKIEKRAVLLRRVGGIALALIGLMLVAYISESGDGARRVGQAIGYYIWWALIPWAVWSMSSWKKNNQKGYLALMIGAVYLLGGSYDAYQINAEQKESTYLLQQFTTYISKLSAGELVTKAEIQKANLGKYEPFMLSVQEYHASIFNVFNEYQRALEQAQLSSIFSSEIITKPSGINEARTRLNSLNIDITKFETELNGMSDRLVVTEKTLAMPESFRYGVLSTLEPAVGDTRHELAEFWNIERSLIGILQQRINFLDQKRGAYKLSPRKQLLFAKQDDLNEYNNQLFSVQNIAQQEENWKQRNSAKFGEKLNKLANQVKELQK